MLRDRVVVTFLLQFLFLCTHSLGVTAIQSYLGLWWAPPQIQYVQLAKKLQSRTALPHKQAGPPMINGSCLVILCTLTTSDVTPLTSVEDLWIHHCLESAPIVTNPGSVRSVPVLFSKLSWNLYSGLFNSPFYWMVIYKILAFQWKEQPGGYFTTNSAKPSYQSDPFILW